MNKKLLAIPLLLAAFVLIGLSFPTIFKEVSQRLD